MSGTISKREFDKQFKILKNSGSGDCLFLSVSQLKEEYNHIQLRELVCQYWPKIKRKNTEFYNTLKSVGEIYDDNGELHENEICKPSVYASIYDIALLCEAINTPIYIYSYNTQNKNYGIDLYSPGTILKKKSKTINSAINIKFNGENHFEALKHRSPLYPEKKASPKTKKVSLKKASPKTQKASPKSSSSKNKKLSSKTRKKSSPKTRKKKDLSKYQTIDSDYDNDMEEAIYRSTLTMSKSNN